jgi:fatty-acyl-CoA synthase
MGIGYGDGIGSCVATTAGFVETTLAAAKLGASALYLNTMFAGPQLVEVTRREGPKALVYDEEFAELLDGVDESVQRIVGWTEGETEAPTLDSLIASAEDSNLKPPPDKPRFVILTSGTTGTPKGAQRSSPDGLFALAALIERIPFRSRETMMIAAPLFHSWGFFHFVMSLPTASTIVLRRRFDPEETLRSVRDHRAQVLAVVPGDAPAGSALPEEDARRVPDLPRCAHHRRFRLLLPGELATGWMDRFGDNVYNLYGSTEGLLGDGGDARGPARRAGDRRLPPRGP